MYKRQDAGLHRTPVPFSYRSEFVPAGSAQYEFGGAPLSFDKGSFCDHLLVIVIARNNKWPFRITRVHCRTGVCGPIVRFGTGIHHVCSPEVWGYWANYRWLEEEPEPLRGIRHSPLLYVQYISHAERWEYPFPHILRGTGRIFPNATGARNRCLRLNQARTHGIFCQVHHVVNLSLIHI